MKEHDPLPRQPDPPFLRMPFVRPTSPEPSPVAIHHPLSTIHLFLAATLALTLPSRADDAAKSFQSRVQPLLKTYCTECHGGEKPKAKINLSGEHGLLKLTSERDLWFRALDQIEAGTM